MAAVNPINGLILLYWNYKEKKWQDTEVFSVNGGSTLGMQWFCIPNTVYYKGNNTFGCYPVPFYEKKKVKIPDVSCIKFWNSGSKTEQSVWKTCDVLTEEFWVTTDMRWQDCPLLTEPTSQLPYVETWDVTHKWNSGAEGKIINWFTTCPHNRFARG